MAEDGPEKLIAQRQAHGETVLYSNLLTQLHMNLEAHPTLAGSAGGDLLERLFFDVRQVPISASKDKIALFGDDPRELWREFREGWGMPTRAAVSNSRGTP
jgi:hypothetical protein